LTAVAALALMRGNEDEDARCPDAVCSTFYFFFLATTSCFLIAWRLLNQLLSMSAISNLFLPGSYLFFVEIMLLQGRDHCVLSGLAFFFCSLVSSKKSNFERVHLLFLVLLL
jgi:hypothetical protein